MADKTHTTTTTTGTTTKTTTTTTKTVWMKPKGNVLRGLGVLICLCAAVSLGLGVADLAITIITFSCIGGSTPCSGIPYIMTWLASGIWGSMPAFVTGIMAILVKAHPDKDLMRFKVIGLLTVLLALPAMVAISALEWVLGGLMPPTPMWYTLSFSPLNFSASGIFNYLKFAIPVAVCGFGIIEFLLIAIALCYATARLKKTLIEESTETATQKPVVPVQPPPPAPAPVPVPQPPPQPQEPPYRYIRPPMEDDNPPPRPHPRPIPYYYPVPVPRPMGVAYMPTTALTTTTLPATGNPYTMTLPTATNPYATTLPAASNPYATNPYYTNYAVNPSSMLNPYPTAPVGGPSYIATAGPTYIAPQPAYAYYQRRRNP